jgi:hypothetical protein
MRSRSSALLVLSAVIVGACGAPTASRAPMTARTPERPSVGFGPPISEAEPNRDGFIVDDRPDTKAVRCMRDCK